MMETASNNLLKEIITDEMIERLRDNCKCARDLAMIDLLYSTGIRVGELVNLNISDIEISTLVKNMLKLNDKDNVDGYSISKNIIRDNLEITIFYNDETNKEDEGKKLEKEREKLECLARKEGMSISSYIRKIAIYDRWREFFNEY